MDRRRFVKSVGCAGTLAAATQLPARTSCMDEMMRLSQNRPSAVGMGYVVLDKDKTFAEQVTQENTIYEIRYDFDLGRETKEIPVDCVLKFEGGSLKNGTLSGNASLITGCEYNILNGVYLYGSWANAECNLRWWGCSPASGIDNSDAIKMSFNSSIPIIRVSESYGISKPISLPYNKKIIGRSALNNKLTGFYANSDFSSSVITFTPREGAPNTYTKEVHGMFYHRDLTMLELHDLYIDARYNADFAIEHIDLYGAPHLFDLHIMNARKVGLLQYAAEMPIYDHLYITGCHIGMLISTNRFDENYTPMTSSYYSGEKVGMPNLVSLSKARFIGNNYGIICYGLYDLRAEDLETAYNSIAGVVMYNTRADITKYYSEGDSSCDFYIKEGVDENGTSAWGQVKYYTHETLGDVERVVKSSESEAGKKYSQKKGYTLPSLITANLDGKEYGGCLAAKQSTGFLRASMYSFNTNLNITSAFISFHPRSYIYIDPSSYENFTTREAGGIDAMLLVDGGTCYIGFLNKYVLSNGTSTALYASILCNMSHGADINVITANHAIEVLPIERGQSTGNSFNSIGRTWRISYGNCRRIDFNHDIETARRDLDYQLKNEMASTYVGTYDNRPLYKREGAHTKLIWIPKSKIAARFAGKKAVMAKVIFRVIAETTTRLGIITAYYDSKYAGVSNYNSNQSPDKTYAPGYYEFELPVLIDTFFDYDIIGINTDVSQPSDNIAVSHIYFYEIEDGIKAPHNFTAVTLQRGTTAQRPNPSFAGQQYFDTTLGRPIWWNGTAWVDNAGETA